MKHYGFIMLIVVLSLATMPLSAIGLEPINDEFSSLFSEAKINVWEEVGYNVTERVDTFFVFESMQGLESCWSGNRLLNLIDTAVYPDVIIITKFNHPKLVPRVSGH